MARVTVEDCIEKVKNRFELVMVAAQRSREISSGSDLTIESDNNKIPVVALREIAKETVSVPVIKDIIVRGMQKHVDTDTLDEPQDDSDSMEEVTEIETLADAFEEKIANYQSDDLDLGTIFEDITQSEINN